MASQAIRPIRIEGNIAYVPLTLGYEAIIDARDVEKVGGQCWRAMEVRRKDGSIYTVYAKRSVRERGKIRTIYLHRHLMDAPDGMDVDHRDGNGLNNRRANLRVATRAENMRNQRLSAANTSGYKGVVWSKAAGKWQAQIKFNKRTRVIGYFVSLEDAAAAYAIASAELHREFGRVA